MTDLNCWTGLESVTSEQSFGPVSAGGGFTPSRTSLLVRAYLVDVGPVNSVAAAGNFPVLALRGCGVEQPRIPDERRGDDATVAQADADGVVGELDVQHAFICTAMRRRCRKAHSMPPEAADANPSSSIVSRAVFSSHTVCDRNLLT